VINKLDTVIFSQIGALDSVNYLRQGGHVFAGFCLSVFVCVCVCTR